MFSVKTFNLFRQKHTMIQTAKGIKNPAYLPKMTDKPDCYKQNARLLKS